MLVMYLDESGDHDLVNIDPTYSVFVIGGVIVDRAYVRTVLEPTVQAFKREWFGRDDIILHTADIARARNGAGRSATSRTAGSFSRRSGARTSTTGRTSRGSACASGMRSA